MVLVPPLEIIGGSDKLLASLEGIVDEIDFFEKGVRKARLERKHDEVLAKLDSGRARLFQEKNRLYNAEVLRAFPSLSDVSQVLFLTGQSPDLTPESQGIPRKYGIDPMADIHVISTRILEQAKVVPDAYASVLFVPVAPVLWPFVVDKDELSKSLVIRHPLQDIALSISEQMIEKGKRGYGRLEKSLEMRSGEVNFQFYPQMFSFQDLWYRTQRSPTLFSAVLEKYGSVEEAEKRARLETTYNEKLMINAYMKVVQALDLEQITHFSLKGSYSLKIMKKVSQVLDIPLHIVGGEGGPLTKGKVTTMGEADQSCLSALDGFLRAEHVHKTGEQLPAPIRKGISRQKGLDFKNCPYEEHVLCSHQAKCDQFRNPCAMNHYHSLDPQILIREDAKRNYYGLYEGIEGIIADLLLSDNPMFNLRGMNFSWERERGDISPLILPNRDALLAKEKSLRADLRASGLSGRCALSPIISLYNERLQDLMGPLAPEDNDFSKIGTGIHSFLLDQFMVDGMPVEFAPNNIWRKLGKPVVFRNEYTEQFAPYTHIGSDGKSRIISGHIDCPIVVDGKNIGVIDIKRSRRIPYPKWDYRYQLLTYALALREHSGLDPEAFYLILVNRPFEKDIAVRHLQQEGLYRLQQITIMKVDAHDDPLLGLLADRIDTVYAEKERLLVSNEYVLQSKHEKTLEGECDACGKFLPDQRAYCDFIAEYVTEHKNLGEMLKL
ncbi:MAG: PD-(D/E)XK nuclease family protein [Nanoarchaeota archaeon]